MGRGDLRTRRGKIFAGSYGNTRPQGKKKPVQKPAAPTKGAGGSR
jgi:ribosomal small subunit protein bTHX